MPPVQFTNPETHGVALYYLPPPGEPHNWLAEYLHSYTSTTNVWANQAYMTWLQLQGQDSGLLDLERQITERMKSREATWRQAQSLAIQQQMDAAETLRVFMQAQTQIVTSNQRAQTDLAVERTRQRTSLIEAGALLTDPKSAELLNTAKVTINQYAQDLRDAARLPTPEERRAATIALEQDLRTALHREALAAGTLDPEQIVAMGRELNTFARQTSSVRGAKGEEVADPDFAGVLLDAVNDVFRPEPERPERQFGAQMIDPNAVTSSALRQTKQALGLDPDAPLPASGGGSVRMGTSGPAGITPGQVSTIGPDDLNLDDLRDQILADRRNRERTLEELMVRFLAPGVVQKRDRQVERALRDEGIDVSGQRALNVYRAIQDATGGAGLPGQTQQQQGQPAVGQDLGQTIRPQAAPWPAGTTDPRTGRLVPSAQPPPPPAAGGGGARGGGRGATARDMPEPPRPRLRPDTTGLLARQEAPSGMQITVEQARELDGQIATSEQLDQMFVAAMQNPDAISDHVWDELVYQRSVRFAIDDALFREANGVGYQDFVDQQRQRIEAERQESAAVREQPAPAAAAPTAATPSEPAAQQPGMLDSFRRPGPPPPSAPTAPRAPAPPTPPPGGGVRSVGGAVWDRVQELLRDEPPPPRSVPVGQREPDAGAVSEQEELLRVLREEQMRRRQTR